MTLTKGALAMILAGAVTFSVTNSLLVDQSSKLLMKENALKIFEDREKEGLISQAEKTVKDQTPTIDVQKVQTKISNDSPNNTAIENKNMSNMDQASSQQNTKVLKTSTTTNLASTNETIITTPAVNTKPKTSVKSSTTTQRETGTTSRPTATTAEATPEKSEKPTPTTTTTSKENNTASKPTAAAAETKPKTSKKATTTTPPPKKTNPSSELTTITNRGQEVSQSAKGKAAKSN
ncbi:hypothetical protein [Metabacillus halosaccharovorans]|uniref:hypothetical protein n=1 Tax=Metabacillus halosaccharovorans TaxID=930124 RepID=UPI000995310A|nr:hypothetical protein [Metabacillus halosaccharovorans]